MRPRVLFLHSSDELYGADRMLLEIVEAARTDADVEVWLPNDLQHPSNPLCVELERRAVFVRHMELPVLRRVLRNPAGMVTLLRRSFRLFSSIRTAKPDAVYCVTSAVLLAAPVARSAGVATVLVHFQEICSSSDRLVLGPLASACHSAVAISEAVKASLPKRLRRRTEVVPNGTPEPESTDQTTKHVGQLRFLVASRWNSWKGHSTLLTAWDRAGSPGHLVILGGPPPSGDAVDVRDIVTTLERPETVSVTGELQDVSGQILESDIMIVPSDRPEPFGLVAIEAFARSRPVVASAGGGLLEIVTPGRDGWLFPPGDVDALATILRTITRAEVEKAGRQARDTYLERYTSQKYAERWRHAVVPLLRRR